MKTMTTDDLAALLRADIRNGKYSRGEKLPSEGDLSRKHGVSVRMVREALAQLVGTRTVHKVRGSGTFVL